MALVVTNYGKVKGRQCRSKQGKTIYSFKGIPYAQPPIGHLRFERPKQVKPWRKTLDLTGKKESPTCLQVNVISPESKFLIGEEDCLYLNVFTPHLPENGVGLDIPVIVFIHGGAFCVGSNESRLYGPDYFLDHSVVLVTINYRLGPLGFLTLDKAHGNQGMHDQILALKWIQSEIENFSGNPKNVTIMGESAGAMSCLLHFVSPLSRGLFHKIIAASGSPSTPFLHLDRKPQCYGRAFANHLVRKKLKKTEINDDKLLQMLKEMTAKTIVESTTLFKDWDVPNPLQWKPCLDPDSNEPFMPISFNEAVKQGKFDKNIPIMTGCTSEEGLIFSTTFLRSPRRWRMLFDQWNHWAPLLFFNRETDLISSDDISKSEAIKQRFFPEAINNRTPIPTMNENSLKKLELLFSTAIFQAPMLKDMSLLAKNGAKIYAFEFAYKGSMTMTDIFRLSPLKLCMNFFGRHVGVNFYRKNLGVCHGDDLLYLFPFVLFSFPKALKTESDKLTSHRFLRFISNFAAKGTPGNVDNVEWHPAATENFQVLRIDKDLSCSTMESAKKRRLKFWIDNVYANEKGWSWSQDPITQIHSVIAERRSILLDSQQMFT